LQLPQEQASQIMCMWTA